LHGASTGDGGLNVTSSLFFNFQCDDHNAAAQAAIHPSLRSSADKAAAQHTSDHGVTTPVTPSTPGSLLAKRKASQSGSERRKRQKASRLEVR